ncbi:MAG: PEP-CTERM sorting domain-containing protein [Phycisphaerales bacterium]|nr:PEP-CTERM sorting domain-containing protein [Phycisphaerales bacterium]
MRSTLLAVAVSIGLTGAAQATVLLDQNFDDTGVFVNGTTLTATGIGNPATSVGEWTTVEDVLPGAAVTNAESFSSAQSLAVNRNGSNTAGTGQFLGSFDNAVSTGIVEVSFRAKRTRAGWDSDDPADGIGNEFTGSASTFQVGTTSNLNLTFPASTDIGFKLHSDNSLYVFDNGSPTQVVSNIDTLDFSANGTWHGYKLVINLDAHTYDAYYSADGTDAGFVQVFNDAAYSAANVASIDAVTGRSAFYTIDRGPVFYDNVYVAQVPEPASLLMLTLGAGFVTLKRCRRAIAS